MRGRDKFRKYKVLINVLGFVIGLLPKLLRECVWTMIDNWRGKFALAIRYAIAKNSAQSCGDVVSIGPGVEIRHWENLSLGNHVSIHRNCYLDAAGEIAIGNNVSIAHQSSILSLNHTYGNPSLPIRDNPVQKSAVTISDNVWIGCGCRILAGVSLQPRTIIAAGAVVTKSHPGGTIIGGVPAVQIKNISLSQASWSNDL